MIHLSFIHKLIEEEEFSIKFIKKDGSVVEAPRCRCTSFFSNGRTMNILFIDSNEVRKIRRCTIIEFNGEEVFL